MTEYRYSLGRQWCHGDGTVVWVMLNPSTADDVSDDATITRITRRSRDAGYAGLRVVNLFGARATDPKDLAALDDPVGPNNAAAIALALANATGIVYAWGGSVPAKLKPLFWQQIGSVDALAVRCGLRPLCLGLTAGGHPRHPGRLAWAVQLEAYPEHRRVSFTARPAEPSAALAVLDQDVCPNDGTPLHADGMDEPALFKHGGYGATRRTVVLTCPTCAWAITREVSEITPRTKAPA